MPFKLIYRIEAISTIGFQIPTLRIALACWLDDTESLRGRLFKEGDQVLLCNSKFCTNLGNFILRWLGPYQVEHIYDNGSVQLWEIYGYLLPTLVNGSKFKLYHH